PNTATRRSTKTGSAAARALHREARAQLDRGPCGAAVELGEVEEARHLREDARVPRLELVGRGTRVGALRETDGVAGRAAEDGVAPYDRGVSPERVGPEAIDFARDDLALEDRADRLVGHGRALVAAGPLDHRRREEADGLDHADRREIAHHADVAAEEPRLLLGARRRLDRDEGEVDEAEVLGVRVLEAGRILAPQERERRAPLRGPLGTDPLDAAPVSLELVAREARVDVEEPSRRDERERGDGDGDPR